MRKALLGLCALLLACDGAAAERSWSCQLTRVVDGDTLHARCAGEQVKVRLLRIDTPEREQKGYRAAGAALRRFLGDGAIELEFEQPGLPVADDYGRLLAYVRVRGELANVEMVRLGWSAFWTKYGEGRFADAFRRAEREARAARRGMWADSSPAAAPAPASSPRRQLVSTCRPREECCRVCEHGAACGDSCIDAESTCRTSPGCACDRRGVCESAPR